MQDRKTTIRRTRRADAFRVVFPKQWPQHRLGVTCNATLSHFFVAEQGYESLLHSCSCKLQLSGRLSRTAARHTRKRAARARQCIRRSFLSVHMLARHELHERTRDNGRLRASIRVAYNIPALCENALAYAFGFSRGSNLASLGTARIVAKYCMIFSLLHS